MACAQSSELTENRIYEIWSSDLQQLFAQAGIIKRRPTVNPDCPYEQQNYSLQQLIVNPIQITSPLEGRQYQVQLSSAQNSVPLNATSSSDVQQFYWFVNQSYLGASSAHQSLLWQPRQSGQYNISVTDEKGRSTSRQVNVKVLH